MSSWLVPEEREALVRLVLLELFKQAMDDGHVLGEVSNQGGGRPAGRPPAGGRPGMDALLGVYLEPGARSVRYHPELVALLRRDVKDDLDSAEKRRLAELVEMIFGERVAFSWWEKAAESGDEDAIEYLEVLREELGGDRDIRDVEAARSIALLKDVLSKHLRAKVRDRRQEIEQILGEAADAEQLIGEVEDFLIGQVPDGGRRI